ESLDVRVPAAEVPRELVGRAARAPRFDTPVGALEHADEVHHRSAAQWVMHDVPARPDPVRADPACHVRRQPLHRCDAAPSHVAGELRAVRAEQSLAHARMHPVRADENVAARRGAAFQLERDAIVVLGKAGAARAEVDGIGLERPDRARQDLQEIGPVDREVRKAVALDRLRAEVEQLPRLARAPQADLLALRLARERLEFIAHAERVEHARAVGGQLHARADLAQLVRLLVDLDVGAQAQQGQRGGEPADAGACYQDTADGYLSAATPARAHWPSCAPLPPESPMLPITLPSRMSSSPPSEVTNPRRLR